MKWAVWRNLYDNGAGSLPAGTIQETIQKQKIAKLLIRLKRTDTSTVPTPAQLKAMMVVARLVAPGGVDRELINASLYDLAMLTDAVGGFGYDWVNGKGNVNAVIPMGLDLEGMNGALEYQITFPATIAALQYSLFTVDDGTMQPTLVYRTRTTSGVSSFQKAYAIYSRDEAGTSCDLQVGGDPIKAMPYEFGRALFAEEAKIETDLAFARIMSERNPQPVLIYPTAAHTLFSVEAP